METRLIWGLRLRQLQLSYRNRRVLGAHWARHVAAQVAAANVRITDDLPRNTLRNTTRPLNENRSKNEEWSRKTEWVHHTVCRNWPKFSSAC